MTPAEVERFPGKWFFSPPASVCPKCRRIVVRRSGHDCAKAARYHQKGNHR